MRCRYSHCPQLTDKVNVLFGLMLRSKCQDGISCVRDSLGKGGAEAEWSPAPTGQVWWLWRRVGEECPGLQGQLWTARSGSQRQVPAAVTRWRSPASPWKGPSRCPLCTGTGSLQDMGLKAAAAACRQLCPLDLGPCPFSATGHWGTELSNSAEVTWPVSVEVDFTWAGWTQSPCSEPQSACGCSCNNHTKACVGRWPQGMGPVHKNHLKTLRIFFNILILPQFLCKFIEALTEAVSVLRL